MTDFNTATLIHDDDPFHVLLDCIAEMKQRIMVGMATPWTEYGDPEPDDPKTTLSGYLLVLERAHEMMEDRLNYGDAGILRPQAKADKERDIPLAIKEVIIDG